MHILLIVSWYKTKENPISGTFFEEQARALARIGNTVTIYCPSFIPYTSKEKEVLTDYNDNGIRTISQSIKALIPRSRKFNYKHLAKNAYKTLQHLGILSQIDIVHAHTFRFAGIVALKIKQEVKINYVITEHFTQLTVDDGITHKVDLNYAKTVYVNALKCFVVSNYYKKQIVAKLQLAEDLFEVLYNMVNKIFLNEKLHSKKKLIIFSTGFLIKRKNHTLQLNSFKLLLRSNPAAILKIAGDGPEIESIKIKIKELGLNDNVVLLGSLNRVQLLKELKKASLFIHTSLYETFGVVLIEALAMGIPIVVLDSGGPRDIVNINNGVLVKENNATSFCKAMIDVINNIDDFNPEELRKDCKQNYSEEVIISQLENTYSTTKIFKKTH
ncbi:glycosyltransferase family 4 protein [Saccharicrinis aurantiacus]|uniref:glycosyltransferase family 4 protein n=1 Tax=Saccharicrinis aurantiacus TaxID=1849719 RepID=UPI0024904F8F|nr:glycosyltransferase family 4 protein [Saccharicrinis aurantiacus]